MPAISIVGAVASGIGAIAAVGGGIKSSVMAQDNLDLQKKNNLLSNQIAIGDIDKQISDMRGAIDQYEIDIRDATSQVDSYDKWLGNYSKQYAQEVQSKQAQTDALKASGKETYENFLGAIGYADAMAGATGRVGAGTSQAATTGMLDQKLVDYVGEDRTLDANGGLFGSQLTAANMEMDQLKTDLEFQRQEMTANRDNALSSIQGLHNAINLTQGSINKSTAAKNDLQNFVNKNFKPDGTDLFRQEVRAGLKKLDPWGLLF